MMKTEKTYQEKVARTIQPVRDAGTMQFVDNRHTNGIPEQPVQWLALDEEDALQGKFSTAPVQMMEDDEELAPIQQKPNLTGLPDHLKWGMEQLSGCAMDDVRVHYNSSLPATVQAHAYTQGKDIYVALGQEQYVPHEAAHAAYQMGEEVSPTTEIEGIPVNDDAMLEHQADVMGQQAEEIGKEAEAMETQANDMI